ncbi:MAG: serine/threonine protein kinase, partial [Burkholderiaceae bacterium]
SKAAPAAAGAARPATGVIVLDVAPWGEVFVDNKPVGVTPPLAELKLPAGRHTIEIRHGDRPAIVAQVDVDPSKPQQIRHRFE